MRYRINYAPNDPFAVVLGDGEVEHWVNYASPGEYDVAQFLVVQQFRLLAA